MSHQGNDRSAPADETALAEATALLRECATDHGFLASATDTANYRRVWARDGVITGLGALMVEDEELIAALRRTLETLMRHQGPHGHIPSNVDPETNEPDFGRSVGRIDGNLWFIIGCGEYWQATGDDAFIEKAWPAMRKARTLLGAWEFNNRGLLYVPQGGDWADEFLHNGYVLYDQLLYLQAQRTLAAVHRARSGLDGEYEAMQAGMQRLTRLIRANYWLDDGQPPAADIYHEVLYEHGRRATEQKKGRYWLPFFAPFGYGYRFDALANILVSLLGVSNERQCDEVDRCIDSFAPAALRLIPAFHPVVTPDDSRWNRLQAEFSHSFKNEPHCYQNGGLWPMITGFHVVALAQRGRSDQARDFLRAIHRSNALPMNGREWSFPEYLHGRTLAPEGTPRMAWSAASALMGHHALRGRRLLRIQ